MQWSMHNMEQDKLNVLNIRIRYVQEEVYISRFYRGKNEDQEDSISRAKLELQLASLVPVLANVICHK